MEKVKSISCEKFICDIYRLFLENEHNDILWYFDKALKEQGLKYVDGCLFQVSSITPKFKVRERIRKIGEKTDQVGKVISKVDTEHECYVFLHTSEVMEFSEQDNYELYCPCKEGKSYRCKKSFGLFKENNIYLLEFMSGNSLHLLCKEEECTYIYDIEYNSSNPFSEYFEPLEKDEDESENREIKMGGYYRCKKSFICDGKFTEGHTYYSPVDAHLMDDYGECVDVYFFNEYFKVIGVEGPKLPKTKQVHFYEVGQWIVTNKEGVFEIKEIKEGKYVLEQESGNSFEYPIEYIDKKAHLWSVNDIKDGDFIKTNFERIVIFKRTSPDGPTGYYEAYGYMTIAEGKDLYDFYSFDQASNYGKLSDIERPASKAEIDIMMEEIKREGYIWDEKRKLFLCRNSIVDDNEGFIKHNKWYVCIKDYYEGGKKRAVEGEIVQAKNGMYMMGLKGDSGKEYFRRWKITDIRNGDIVTFSDSSHVEEPFIGVFKEWYLDEDKKMDKIVCYFHIKTFGGTFEIDTCEEYYWNAYNIEPSRIEETNLLFDTLKENGFIWNSEKRKLEKVPDVTINTNAEKKINVEHLVKSYLMTKPQVVTTEECYRQGIMDVIDLLKKGWRI